MRYVTATILTALVVWVVLLVSCSWLHAQRDMRNARSGWPSVHGTVTSARVVVADDAEPDPAGHGLFVTVGFEYEVDGKKFSGDQDWWCIGTSDGEAAYYPGTTATVHYDPARPERAAIEPEKDSHWWQLSMVCIPVFGILTGFTAIWSWAKRRVLGWAVATTGFLAGCVALYSLSLITGVPFFVFFYVVPYLIIGIVVIAESVRTRINRSKAPRDAAWS